VRQISIHSPIATCLVGLSIALLSGSAPPSNKNTVSNRPIVERDPADRSEKVIHPGLFRSI
jgi:hypothetical protein